MSLESFLAGLKPSNLNAADASSKLKEFYDRVADSVDGLKTVDSGAVIERAKDMASRIGDSKAVTGTMSSLLATFESKDLPDVGSWLKQLSARLPNSEELTHFVDLVNQQKRAIVFPIFLLGSALLALAVSNLVVALIHALGFGMRGVAGGSPAAGYQSAFLRGNIARGSPFSSLQSTGAQGSLSFGAKATIVACLAGVAWYASARTS